MAEKPQEPQHPPPPAGRDTEAAATSHSRRILRKLRDTRCLVYILLFLIFHAAIILIFAQTILKVRTPKFRVLSATFEDFNAGNPANPSFEAGMNADLSLKNPNFGTYKYRNATVLFYYRDTQVGEGLVRSSRVKWRSTKKFDIGVDLSFANGQAIYDQLSSDLRSGVVPLTCRSRIRGKVEALFLMKKSRSTEMNCSMEIVTATRQLRNIVCH